jgi:type 1 glutamine amidotransferase
MKLKRERNMKRFLFLLINLLIFSYAGYLQNTLYIASIHSGEKNSNNSEGNNNEVLELALVPSQSKINNPIPVLIVDGFSNHDWRQTTILTKWILEESGLFKVDISTIPTDSIQLLNWEPKFTDYAVVIQNTNNIFTPHLRWPVQAELDLENFVKKGGGLYILHSANNAFSHWKEYEKMMGMGWRPSTFGYALEIDSSRNIIRIPPGEGSGTGHGNRFNALIQILNPHPINMGYPDKWQTTDTEVYNFSRGYAENLTVLSYAYDSTSTHRMWPVEWVVAYGKGRVYNSSLGHVWQGDVYPANFRCIGYQTTVIRVTEWLAYGQVTYPVPSNFPTKDSLSLRSNSDFINLYKPE